MADKCSNTEICNEDKENCNEQNHRKECLMAGSEESKEIRERKVSDADSFVFNCEDFSIGDPENEDSENETNDFNYDDDSSDFLSSDSDTDITCVTPMSSCSVSPLPFYQQLENVMKGETLKAVGKHLVLPEIDDIGTHSNVESGDMLRNGDRPRSASESSGMIVKKDFNIEVNGPCQNENVSNNGSVSDMKLLVEAVNELENVKPSRSASRIDDRKRLDDNRTRNRRRNMSFSNDEVRRIDHENRILLRRILDQQKPKHRLDVSPSYRRTASSAINRTKEQKRIEQENLILLRKLQVAKSSQEVRSAFSPVPSASTSSRPLSRVSK